MRSKQYYIKEKDFSAAKMISGAKTILAKLNRPTSPEFPNAKYIWPLGCTRAHIYRLFTPKKQPVRVEAAFLCDNQFDLWLNGGQICHDTQELPLTDITELLTNGENNLHIRVYQSATFNSYSAAISGGIRLFYGDGTTEEIVTDSTFKTIQLVNFWDTKEPDGFETATTSGYKSIGLNVMEMHPIALRRSFLFIRDIELKELPTSATLYASALGCYEPYLNGQRVSDSFFMPFCDNYRREYQSFDVLPLLKVGNNTVGMISGNGSYNCHSWGTLRANIPELIGELEFKYADGRTEHIYTDENWLCTPSPLIENDLQYGERYDARLEIANWCTPDSDRTVFAPVSHRPSGDQSVFIEQSYPPIKKITNHHPVQISTLDDGSPLFDVGQCIAGRARVTLHSLTPGKQIRIRYCERLNSKGEPESGAYVNVYYPNDCEQDGKSPAFLRNIDVYTAKGVQSEIYECRFAYTGFRYIWVEGLDSPDQLVEIVANELHNDLEYAGDIITESLPVQRIFNATKRSWLNNIFNGPTDCPTREKNFWNGDMQIFSHTACWLTDNSDFLARWTDNGKKMHDGPYGWEDEIYELPLTLYRFYGDREILRKRFPQMLALIKKREEFPGMVLPENPISPYCDWLSPTGISPSKKFFSGCWYYHMLVSVAYVAEVLGEIKTADELKNKAAIARDEFNLRHLNADGNDYDAECQCGIVLPLAFGIAPKEAVPKLAKTLVEYIEKEDFHLTTGFIGTRYLPEVLCDNGYTKVLYKLLVQDSFPSWLNMLNSGATAICESWLGENDPDKSISMAHFSLGSVTGAFFEYLGGIRIKDSAPGLRHVVLKPHPIKEIGSLKTTYRTPYGVIITEWHYEGDTPVFSYSLPDGITAEVLY